MSHLYFIFSKLSIIFCAICLCNITNSSQLQIIAIVQMSRKRRQNYLFVNIGWPCNKDQNQQAGALGLLHSQKTTTVYIQARLSPTRKDELMPVTFAQVLFSLATLKPSAALPKFSMCSSLQEFFLSFQQLCKITFAPAVL